MLKVIVQDVGDGLETQFEVENGIGSELICASALILNAFKSSTGESNKQVFAKIADMAKAFEKIDMDKGE